MTVSTMHDIINDTGVTITKGKPIIVNDIGITIPARNINASFFFVIFSNMIPLRCDTIKGCI